MKENFDDRSDHPEQDVPPIVEEIQQRMGALGISGYNNLPRKHKKAAKKLAQGKTLTQRELARLEAVRRRQADS